MINNNLNVLPFYKNIRHQDYKKWYAFKEVYPLVSPINKLLPFQIAKPSGVNPIQYVNLHNFDLGGFTDITTQVTDAGLSIVAFDDYDLIINPSILTFPTLDITPGRYYVEIAIDSENTFYSEIFQVVADTSKFMKIEYWDRGQIQYSGGHIDYSNQFKNYFFIQTTLGKPEYPFEEEAQKRDGRLYIEKQISEKLYKFEFLAPEYLCDAIRIIRMHDYIKIYNDGAVYNVENIIFEPKWREQGNIAVVEVEFECNTIIKKIGTVTHPQTEGDFNNDYNNDYD